MINIMINVKYIIILRRYQILRSKKKKKKFNIIAIYNIRWPWHIYFYVLPHIASSDQIRVPATTVRCVATVYWLIILMLLYFLKFVFVFIFACLRIILRVCEKNKKKIDKKKSESL